MCIGSIFNNQMYVLKPAHFSKTPLEAVTVSMDQKHDVRHFTIQIVKHP